MYSYSRRRQLSRRRSPVRIAIVLAKKTPKQVADHTADMIGKLAKKPAAMPQCGCSAVAVLVDRQVELGAEAVDVLGDRYHALACRL